MQSERHVSAEHRQRSGVPCGATLPRRSAFPSTSQISLSSRSSRSSRHIKAGIARPFSDSRCGITCAAQLLDPDDFYRVQSTERARHCRLDAAQRLPVRSPPASGINASSRSSISCTAPHLDFASVGRDAGLLRIPRLRGIGPRRNNATAGSPASGPGVSRCDRRTRQDHTLCPITVCWPSEPHRHDPHLSSMQSNVERMASVVQRSPSSRKA